MVCARACVCVCCDGDFPAILCSVWGDVGASSILLCSVNVIYAMAVACPDEESGRGSIQPVTQ